MKTKGIMAVLAAGLATALFATSPSVTWHVDSSAPAGGGGFLVNAAWCIGKGVRQGFTWNRRQIRVCEIDTRRR